MDSGEASRPGDRPSSAWGTAHTWWLSLFSMVGP